MKEDNERYIRMKKVRAITKIKLFVEFFYTGKSN